MYCREEYSIKYFLIGDTCCLECNSITLFWAFSGVLFVPTKLNISDSSEKEELFKELVSGAQQSKIEWSLGGSGAFMLSSVKQQR